MAEIKMRVQMAARWAVMELARFLDLPDLESGEIDVTGRVVPSPPANIQTFCYRAAPFSIWIHVMLSQDGQFLPISALVRDGSNRQRRFRYFSFRYDHLLEFDHIEEMREIDGRFWMVIVST